MRSAFFTLHNTWLFLLFISLAILVATAWHAPMSGDEYVHKVQAEKNIRYLTSFGQDKDALDTPISRLKHYGQSLDTLTIWLAESWNIHDIFRFRHVSNVIVAWLVIVFTSLTTLFVTKDRIAAIFAVLIMLVTARFMGHAMNNLKDVPFALAFIMAIYFSLKFIAKLPTVSWKNFAFICLAAAFGISIRIGGVLIVAYFILFALLQLYFLFSSSTISLNELGRSVGRIASVSGLLFIISFGLGILFWPWALESPLSNPLDSIALMNHYPTTVRQVFEGKLWWSDHFPWYYLFKYLLITLPLIGLAGFLAYFAFLFTRNQTNIKFYSLLVLLAFGFPLFYAAATGANIYGGWRQMLFVLPMFVVLASIGLWAVYEKIKHKKSMIALACVLGVLMLFLPARHMIVNYPYQYVYFNELVGGTRGAYGTYELDYYFLSLRSGYRYIDEIVKPGTSIVAANFIIPEYYDGKPYSPVLIDYYDRSASAWDYAIVVNTFLNPYQLNNGSWPPANTIYEEKVDDVPILAVLKRPAPHDIEGIELLEKGYNAEAIASLELALKLDKQNESILFYLASAQAANGDFPGAYATLSQLDLIYPNNERATDLRGEIALKEGKTGDADALFKENISRNHRYYHSYVNLAESLLMQKDTSAATDVLKNCLRLNPFYVPAYRLYGNVLVAQGDTEVGKKMLEYSIEGPGRYGKN